ncbi:MAG: hypothetical protein JWM82_1607, partial [Myxococcales bacterium]|nr:hypothetical protein [Myxococcales bacterium]
MSDLSSSELSAETQELLRQARGPEEMPSARRRMLKGAVLARVAVASSTVLAAPAAASLFGGSAKVVVGLVVAASLGTSGYLALRPHAPRATQVSVAAPVAPPSVTPVLAEEAPVTAPAPTPVAPRRPVAHHAVRARAHDSNASNDSSDSSDSIVAETSLLRDADRDLRADRPRDALALLARHRAHFPRGVLAPERDAATLIA